MIGCKSLYILAAIVFTLHYWTGVLFAQLPEELQQEEENRAAVISKAARSAVCIFSTDGAGGGSGVIVSKDGYVVTNFHVADPCGTHLLCGLNNGELYDAVIVGIDPVGDVAVIKMLGRDDFVPAKHADSDLIQVGDECFALGNPFLLASDYQPTVTWGIVSGKNRYQFPAGTLLEYPDCIQTDAAINPGNSGGPLFNQQGELIGINGRGSFEKRGRVNVGVGYAISINQVNNFLGSLKSGQILDHATLNAVVSEADDRSVRVTRISEESDAYRKGLRYDDEIIRIAGREITSANDVKNIVGTFPSHWQIPLVYKNDDVQREIMVRLSPVHTRQELLDKIAAAPAPPQSPDVKPEKLKDEIASRFEKRRGFANFRFNRDERDSVLKRVRMQLSIHESAEKLIMSGQTDLDSFTLIFANRTAGLKIGDEAFTLSPKLDLEDQTVPARSGGMLNLLFLWKRLLFEKESELAISSLGTAPFVFADERNVSDGWKSRELYDVLQVIADGTLALFYVDSSGQVVAGEYFPYPESDPCVIEFSDFQEFEEAGKLPGQFRVRYRQLEKMKGKLQRIELAR